MLIKFKEISSKMVRSITLQHSMYMCFLLKLISILQHSLNKPSNSSIPLTVKVPFVKIQQLKCIIINVGITNGATWSYLIDSIELLSDLSKPKVVFIF